MLPVFVKSLLFIQQSKYSFLKNDFDCKSRNRIYVIYLFMLLFIKASKKNILAALAVLVKQKIKLSRQHIRQPQYHNIKVERRLRLSSDGDLKVPLTPNCFKPLKPKLESYVTTVLIRRLLRLICYLGNVRFYQYHVKRSFSCMHLKSNFSETG